MPASVTLLTNPTSKEANAVERFTRLEAQVLHDMVAAVPMATRTELGLEHRRIGEPDADNPLEIVRCHATTHLLVNRIVGLGSGASTERTAVDHALALACATGRHPNFLVQVGPHVVAAKDPRPWLLDAGLVPYRRDWVVLERSTSSLLTTSHRFEVLRATTREGAAFARILCGAFDLPSVLVPMLHGIVERPNWHVYLAFDDARPIAAGALFVHQKSAYLTFAATLPTHRGAGAHDELIARRLRVAAALGCDRVYVETGLPLPGETHPSLDNLIRAGFREAFTRQNFAPPGTSWTGT